MSRESVLAGLRRALGASGGEAERRARVEARLAGHPRGVVPARGQGGRAERIAMFQARAEAADASVERVSRQGDIPAAIAQYLRAHNLPAVLRRGGDALLARLPWDTAPGLEVTAGRAHGHEPVGLSRALAGIAETGTLALASGPDNPTSLNFLPETHIVVVRADDVVGDTESVWDRLRETYGAGQLPRTLNLVTGPSRSADIEQTLILGAHGPKRLHVIVAGK